MKAASYNKYAPPDVVSVIDVPKPAPKDNEVLVQVYCSAVTAGDSRIRAARFPKGFGMLPRLAFGLFGPRKAILGSCFSGVVEAVGKNVSEFAAGDEVCGLSGIRMGAHAEYVTVSASKAIVKKPKSVSHEDAAGVVFGGTAALYFLRDKAQVQQGETVLINGASGAVGTNAVQLAAYYGGTVTGVTSGDNEKLVRSLGAKRTIDYTKESPFDEEARYDVVLDAVGNISIEEGVTLLTPKGRLVLMVAGLGEIARSQRHPQVVTGTAAEKKSDVSFLLSLIADKKLRVVIDKVYTLDDIVKAHQHVDGGKKTGNIIVRMT